MTPATPDPEVLALGASPDERDDRLLGGAAALAARRRSRGLAGDRVLLATSGALVTLGLTLVLLGWAGASRSTHVEEQVPYLISGGLLGVALALVGAVAFFAHWLTVLIREERAREAARRADHVALLAALQDVTAALTPRPAAPTERTPRTPRATRSTRRP